MKRIMMGLALAVAMVAPGAYAQDVRLTVDNIHELAANDMEALKAAVEKMSLDEMEELANEIVNSVHESHRVSLGLEINDLEFRRLTMDKNRMSGTNRKLKTFLSLDPHSDEYHAFIDALSLAERESLGESIIDHFDNSLEVAHRMEINAMEKMVLLRRAQFQPDSSANPLCDPGFVCRAGCYAKQSTCNTTVQTLASTCSDAATTHKNDCLIGNPSEALRCAGEHLIDLGICGAVKTSNLQDCGLAFVGCTGCCSGESFTFPTCWGEFEDLELDESLAPFHPH